MGNDVIRAQKPDSVIHLDGIHVPDCHRKAISRLRETGHAPYRCTRGYKTTGGKKHDEKEE